MTSQFKTVLSIVSLCLTSTLQADEPIDRKTRDCVAKATTTTAIAGCETAARKRWQARLLNNDQRLRFSLDERLRALYAAAQSAWETYRDAEFRVIDATLGKRQDGLALPLAEGAKTEVLRKRVGQQDTLLQAIPGTKRR